VVWSLRNIFRYFRSTIGTESGQPVFAVGPKSRLPAGATGDQCGARPQQIRPARPRSGLLHWSALGDELGCVALLPVVAQQRETGSRRRHDRYRRPPRDNRQQVAVLGPGARCGGLPRENAGQALSRVDRRDGHARPPSTHLRHGHPLQLGATGLSRGVSPIFGTTLPA
jgi:hypothetical protein